MIAEIFFWHLFWDLARHQVASGLESFGFYFIFYYNGTLVSCCGQSQYIY